MNRGQYENQIIYIYVWIISNILASEKDQRTIYIHIYA